MSPQFKNYYEILGVQRSASADSIKQAYRKLAKRYHPDMHPENKKAEMSEKFKEINEAYEVLSDAGKRSKYDRLGENWQSGQEFSPPPGRGPGNFNAYYGSGGRQAYPGGDFKGFSGFSDFFEALFGDAGAGGFQEGFSHGFPGQQAESRRTSRDAEAELPLSIKDAISGGQKQFSFQTAAKCPACGGAGRGLKQKVCMTCGGAGQVRMPRTVTVNLPRGIRDAMRIRLKGQWDSGSGQPADLYLKIKLQPDPLYSVKGDDLETTVTVMPWEAAMGAEIRVPTPEGHIMIKLPEGSHSGKNLRIAGKGLPAQNGGRGDLYAEINIDLPDRITPDMLELFKKMKEL